MATITTDCIYSNPVDFEGEVPSLPTHHFFFQNSECVETITGVATSTPEIFLGYNPTTTISTSSDITIYGSFSAGEIMISLLLLLIILLKLLEFMAKALSNFKTKKTFLQYGGGDVEIREDN